MFIFENVFDIKETKYEIFYLSTPIIIDISIIINLFPLSLYINLTHSNLFHLF